MQVQDDARAGRLGRLERPRAERRVDVVGVHDARAGLARPRRRPRPAAARRPTSPRAACAARRPLRVALEHLDVLVQVLADQPPRDPRPPALRHPHGGSGGAAGGSRAARLVAALVAYLILSYTHPELVRAARRALRASPDASVAVHHDDRRCALGAVDALRIEPPSPIEWGHGSQLAAVLRCLRVGARARGVRLARAALRPGLSGAAAWRRSRRSSLAAPFDAFIRYAPVAAAAAAPRRGRRVRAPLRATAGAPCRAPALAPRSTRSSRSARCRPARTSGFPARPPLPVVPRLRLVLALAPRGRHGARRADAVVDHFLHTIIPTEAFVHTVLANSALRLANDHRRYAVFDPPSRAVAACLRPRRRRRGARVGRATSRASSPTRACSTRSTAA